MKFVVMLVLAFALLPKLASAQTAAIPTTPPSATSSSADPTSLTERERELVRRAVADVQSSYRRSRTSDGIGNIVGGLLVGGIGMYLYLSQDDPTVRLIGVAVAFSSVPQLVAGTWNIFYHTAQEDMAAKLLGDDRLLQGGGLLFVEQEARRAKRARLVGGSTSIVAGGATLASYFLLKEFFIAGPDNILLIFFGVGTAIQVIQGVITLASKSGSERAYAQLLQDLGRDPLAPSVRDPNSISRARIVPTVFADEGKLAPGLGLGFTF